MDYSVISIVLIGLIAGIFHQFMDRAKENDIQAWIRAAVVGAIAAWLTSLVYVPTADMNAYYFGIFMVGYSGDSVVLNLLERKNSPLALFDEDNVQEKEE